jgi:cytochrome c
MAVKYRNGVLSAFIALSALLLLFAAPQAGQSQDPGRGKEVFEKRCTGCHALDKDKEGPRLSGVYGRTSGSVSTFNYSDALKNARITWDAASLDTWLADPEKLVPENDMAFQVGNADERAHVIAYLKQLSER